MLFKGSIVALITPFTEENTIDIKALEALIEWHIQEKSDGIVLLGTSGESPTITDDERFLIIKKAVEISNYRIPIIIGTGSYNTATAVKYTNMAKQLGADGCLVITPYYNCPSQEGCLAHFQEVGKVGIPIIVYHHPRRSGFMFEVQTIHLLSKIPTIVALKDAYGDIEYAKKIIKLPILSGDDERALEWYQNGAVGTISVVANLVPNVWAKFSQFCLQKDFSLARAIFDKYSSLLQSLSLETNPQCVKYALSVMNKCRKNMRLPLLEPKLESQRQVQKSLDQIFSLGIEDLN